MKLKLNEQGQVVVEDGKPVYTHSDGRDIPFDAVATVATITRLNGEARTHREAKEALENKLRGVPEELLANAEAAIAALGTVKNIKDGDLIAAGKVQEIKDAAAKAAQDQVAAANKAHAEELSRTKGDLEKRTNELNSHMIGGGFARSKLITDEAHPLRLAIPADLAEAFFGKNFKVEEGKPVGYDAAGNKIFSRTRPGEVADFDEALQSLVEQYPHKEQIIRSSGSSGTGATGGVNGLKGQDFSKLSPVERMNAARQK